MKDRNIETGVIAERAVLVGLILPGDEPMGTKYDPLAELASLAETAGARVVGRIIQKKTKIEAATYIGSGKVLELAAYVEEKEADVVIFDNELSPSQIRELEEACKKRVIDRTELILDIFASRARTNTAKLQVELAQLEYTAPRLRGMWTHLERIAGAGGGTTAGAVGAIGTRGPGEKQIEIDRRIVQRRVSVLRDELDKIDQRRIREVRSRRDYFTVSLVGYTNAGKSTLMNALTGGDEYVADKLFATLDTKTRRWELGGGQVALLSDTVGFVRNLPHQLVASFKATLEETIHSDLLLHVVDASAHDALQQFRAVNDVLRELHCEDIPVINVLNKIDMWQNPQTWNAPPGSPEADEFDTEDPDWPVSTERSRDHPDIHADPAILRVQIPDAVEISARDGTGLPDLLARVTQLVRERYIRVLVEADPGNGRLLAYISQYGHILDQEYTDGRVRLDIRVPRGELPRVQNMGAQLIEERI